MCSFPLNLLCILVQAVYVLFRDDHQMKLPYCIAIAGFVCAMFAVCIPHLSALRIWLGVSTVISFIYIAIAFALSFKDGNHSYLRHHNFSFLILLFNAFVEESFVPLTAKLPISYLFLAYYDSDIFRLSESLSINIVYPLVASVNKFMLLAFSS